MRAVAALLTEQRVPLVTLTGVGGVGKTRLSLEIARAVGDAFGGAVWFVSLAAVPRGDALLPAVAEAVGALESGGTGSGDERPPLKRVTERLNTLPTSLLLLDNLEQLEDEAAPIVRQLLDTIPGLTILGTSRRPLGLQGETRVELMPLTVPQQGDDPRDAASVRWFLHQARASRWDFEATETDMEAITAICRRLDGLPLALELAAAWSPTLTPSQIAARLDAPLDLLVRREQAAGGEEARHAALRETIGVSFRLLSPEMQRFFCLLSVFRGGWTIEAAQVVSGETQAVEKLSVLRDRSLVVASDKESADQETRRFYLLETLREFADETLRQEGEDPRREARRRHADYYLPLARHIGHEVLQANRVRGFALLDTENANIRAALDFALDDTPERAYAAFMLSHDLAWPWWVRGRSDESRLYRYAERIVERLDDFSGLPRAYTLHYAGLAAEKAGDWQKATNAYREALKIHEEANDKTGYAIATEYLGQMLVDQKHFAEGIALIEEAVGIHQDCGNTQRAIWVMARLGGACENAGDHARAIAVKERASADAREIGDWSSVAVYQKEFARNFHASGHFEEAENLYREAVAIFRRSDETWNIVDALFGLGETLLAQGENKWPEARAALSEALLLWEQVADTDHAAHAASLLKQIS